MGNTRPECFPQKSPKFSPKNLRPLIFLSENLRPLKKHFGRVFPINNVYVGRQRGDIMIQISDGPIEIYRTVIRPGIPPLDTTEPQSKESKESKSKRDFSLQQ